MTLYVFSYLTGWRSNLNIRSVKADTRRRDKHYIRQYSTSRSGRRLTNNENAGGATNSNDSKYHRRDTKRLCEILSVYFTSIFHIFYLYHDFRCYKNMKIQRLLLMSGNKKKWSHRITPTPQQNMYLLTLMIERL